MDLKNIYVGMPVKTTKEEGIWEVLRIDNYTGTIFCNKIAFQHADIKEFKVEELKEL